MTTILRRDFLKFIGVAGVVGIGGTNRAKEPIEPEKGFPKAPDNAYTNGVMELNFKFYNMHDDSVKPEYTTMLAGDGSFNFAGNYNHFDFPERGVLRTVSMEPDFYEFHLCMTAEWVSDGEFHTKIRTSNCFDITINIDENVRYQADQCLYECFSWDLELTQFEIQGRMTGVTKCVNQNS